MLAQFSAENPEYAITHEIIPWATMYTKLQAAFVAGNPPDMFLLHATEVPQFSSYGVLKDLGAWYTSGGGWLPDDDLSEGTLAGVTYEGVKYAIPLDNHGRGLWINKEMFEAAGIDTDPATAPTTYEGWVELFQKLTLDTNGNNALSPDFDPENIAVYGYGTGEWPFVNFLSVLAQHGGSMVSEDGQTITVNSPEGILALQQTYDLIYTHRVAAPPAGFDTWQMFPGQTLAVIPTGTWFVNQATTAAEFDWMAWPQVQWGPQPATWFGSHAFMLPVGLEGEKLAAVETVIRWVSENQVAWAASGQVPARLSAQAALNADDYPSNILLGQTFTDYGVQEPQIVALPEVRAILEPELDAALNNLKSPEQALNDAAQRMQQALDRSF
jgi:ABC-type glycerol-3-phosphate transport system substrate-binding protein